MAKATKPKKRKSALQSTLTMLQHLDDGKKSKRGQQAETLNDFAATIAAQRIQQLKRRKLATYMLKVIKSQNEKVLAKLVDAHLSNWLKQQKSLE